jgi:hypothetical protein
MLQHNQNWAIQLKEKAMKYDIRLVLDSNENEPVTTVEAMMQKILVLLFHFGIDYDELTVTKIETEKR